MNSPRQRCVTILPSGKDCSNFARPGKQYCGTHIRANRAAWLKKIEGGAQLAKVTAKVISSASSVYGAYVAAAHFWPQVLEILSHHINFVSTEKDSEDITLGMEQTASNLQECIGYMRMAESTQQFVQQCSSFQSYTNQEICMLRTASDHLHGRPSRSDLKPKFGKGGEIIDPFTYRESIMSHASALADRAAAFVQAVEEYEQAAKVVKNSLAALGQKEPE